MAKQEAIDMGIRGESEKRTGYCGLHCGDCSGDNGTIANLARDLNRELERERVGELAAILARVAFFRAFERYPQCCEVRSSGPTGI